MCPLSTKIQKKTFPICLLLLLFSCSDQEYSDDEKEILTHLSSTHFFDLNKIFIPLKEFIETNQITDPYVQLSIYGRCGSIQLMKPVTINYYQEGKDKKRSVFDDVSFFTQKSVKIIEFLTPYKIKPHPWDDVDFNKDEMISKFKEFGTDFQTMFDSRYDLQITMNNFRHTTKSIFVEDFFKEQYLKLNNPVWIQEDKKECSKLIFNEQSLDTN